MKGDPAGPGFGEAGFDAHAVAARARQQAFGGNFYFRAEDASMKTDSRILGDDSELSREPAIG